MNAKQMTAHIRNRLKAAGSINSNREDFADYYWGDVHSAERDEFMRGRANSVVQIAYSAWIASANAASLGGPSVELTTVFLLLCMEAEQLSEGQLSSMLDIDRVTLRQMRLDAIEAGMVLANQLINNTPT